MRRNEVARLRGSVMSARTRPTTFLWQEVGATDSPFLLRQPPGWQEAYVGVGHTYAGAVFDVIRQGVQDGWDMREVFRHHAPYAASTNLSAHDTCAHGRKHPGHCHGRWFVMMLVRAA